MPLRNSNKNNKRRTLRNFNKRRKNLKLKYKKVGGGTTGDYKPISEDLSKFLEIQREYRKIVKTELEKSRGLPAGYGTLMPDFPVLPEGFEYDKPAIQRMNDIYENEKSAKKFPGVGVTLSTGLPAPEDLEPEPVFVNPGKVKVRELKDSDRFEEYNNKYKKLMEDNELAQRTGILGQKFNLVNNDGTTYLLSFDLPGGNTGEIRYPMEDELGNTIYNANLLPGMRGSGKYGGSKRRRRSKRTKQRKLSKKRKYTNKNKTKKTKRRRN